MLRWLYICAALLAFCSNPLSGDENVTAAKFSEERVVEPVQFSLLSEDVAIQEGKSFWVALRFEIQEGWHTYWNQPASSGKSLKIELKLPEGYSASLFLWPTPKTVSHDGELESIYDSEFILLTEITPSSSSPEKIATIDANVRWIACSDTSCQPGSSESQLKLSLLNVPSEKNTDNALYFEKARQQEFHSATKDERISLSDNTSDSVVKTRSSAPVNSTIFAGGVGIALLMAFVGGMILNLMPCVLPVISFKILSFMKMAGQSRALTFQHGLAFSFGVLLSFWILAGALLLLQAYGHVVGWGFQLQEPLFVAILAAILVMMSLNFFGVFEPGSIFGSLASQVSTQPKNKSRALLSSFVSGILATAVATPCTGPFLGSAVGYAVTQPPFIALLVFTFLGLGMAVPYLILSAFPQLLSFLPKPGNWMIVFKEFMGFVLLATVLWLVWVFAAQTGTISLIMLLVGFFFITFGCWVYGKWGSPVKGAAARSISVVVAVACLVSAFTLMAYASDSANADNELTSQHSDGVWEKFSPERIALLQQQGIPVFVDFTAKWCLICQANHMALSVERVAKKFEELGVVRMKADWTSNDPIITEELRKFGRSGVPLYLLYGKEEAHEPAILPQVLTPEVLMTHLKAVVDDI